MKLFSSGDWGSEVRVKDSREGHGTTPERAGNPGMQNDRCLAKSKIQHIAVAGCNLPSGHSRMNWSISWLDRLARSAAILKDQKHTQESGGFESSESAELWLHWHWTLNSARAIGWQLWLRRQNLRHPRRWHISDMESSAHGPLENLRSIERKIDGLQDFKLKFGHIEEALTKLQASISSQTVLLEAVQAQVGLKETQEIQQFMIARDSETEVPVPSASDATMVTPPAPAMSRPVSILKKKVRPEDEVDPVPLPKQPPQTFSVIPGQVNEMNQERRLSVASERSRRSRQSTEANQKGQGRRTSLVSLVSQSPDSLSGRRNQVLLDFSKPCSMDDLTVKTTRKLLRGFSALSACPLDESGRSEASATGSGRSGSKTSSREAVLEKTQNLCLDELRANHNAVVTAMSMRSIAPLDTTGGMPFTAELLLVFAGILQWSPRLSMLWVWCLLVTWQTKNTGNKMQKMCSFQVIIFYTHKLYSKRRTWNKNLDNLDIPQL